MVGGQTELGRLSILGGEMYRAKREDGSDGARGGRSRRGTLVATWESGRSITGGGSLTNLGRLTSQLQGICEGFFVSAYELC